MYLEMVCCEFEYKFVLVEVDYFKLYWDIYL